MKRTIDVTLSILLMILTGPLVGVVCLATFATMGRPVFFTQPRPGKNSQLFKLTKLRTMSEDRDSTGRLLSDDLRTTGLGRIVRSLSIDELPELWNILRGEMSFVGPRPLLAEYLPLYTERQRTRHRVRPGLTGWAQINGRNAVSWEERMDMDIWYVENAGIVLDLKIMFLTFFSVVSRKGVSEKGKVTVSKFKGTNS